MNLARDDSEPSFWGSLLSNRGQRGWGATGGILFRQAIPLCGLLLLHWSAQTFLLMAVVNFAWNWALLGVWNLSTSMLTNARRSDTHVTPSKWLLTGFVALVVFCVVSAGLGFPVYFLSSTPPVLDVVWWMSLAMTLAAPVPDLIQQIRQGTAANFSEQQIEAIAQPRRLLLIVGIVPIIAAYGLFTTFPYPLVVKAVAVGYVLFSTLCELRPDLATVFANELPS